MAGRATTLGKFMKRGDTVQIAGKNKILGTVLKVIGNVVMFVPWNSGREDMLAKSKLRVVNDMRKYAPEKLGKEPARHY